MPRAASMGRCFLVVIFCSYTCYIFGQWFFDRYFTPFAIGYLLVLIACLAHFDWKLKSAHMRLLRYARTIFIPTALGLLLLHSLQHVESMVKRNRPMEFYDAAE